MRAAAMGLAVLLCACSNKSDKAAADANAAAFVPPTVTTRTDFSGIQERRFHRLDRDRDDVLTRAEVARAPRLHALDRNGDGEITSSEFSEGQMARFDAMDLNKDGTLTSDERGEARGR